MSDSGTKVFNTLRKINGNIQGRTLNRYGKTFAIEYNLNGFSWVNFVAPAAPTQIKNYLEGDEEITIMPIGSNINKLCAYALASFPSLESIYLFKDGIVELTENSLATLSSLAKIYVPTDKLSTYQSTYASLSFANKFDIIVSDYTWTIPYVSGNILTIELANGFIGMLSNAQKTAITWINVPIQYERFEFGATDKLFDGTFPNVATIDWKYGSLFLGIAKTVTKTGSTLEVE